MGKSQSRSYMKEGREGQRKIGGQEAVESERGESGGGGEHQMETGGVRRGRAERVCQAGLTREETKLLAESRAETDTD